LVAIVEAAQEELIRNDLRDLILGHTSAVTSILIDSPTRER
jgi:hypothetical protein